METQLVQLYVWVCSVYDKHPMLKYQRLSNNWQPLFTDQELATIYLFGHRQGHFTQNRIYLYISHHWKAWFPNLPSYQAVNRRLNEFHESWEVLLSELMPENETTHLSNDDRVLDSLPIMLATRTRSYNAKVAREHADQGYCASKGIYYHGVKIHIAARKQSESLPEPEHLCLTPASEHDLPALRTRLHVTTPGALFGDKAYKDKETEKDLAKHGVRLCTPDKKRPKAESYAVGESSLWSRFVSAMRQPIESLFNWIIEKTGIQNGAKVRSADGLLVHCYAKLTVAFYLLRFNP